MFFFAFFFRAKTKFIDPHLFTFRPPVLFALYSRFLLFPIYFSSLLVCIVYNIKIEIGYEVIQYTGVFGDNAKWVINFIQMNYFFK